MPAGYDTWCDPSLQWLNEFFYKASLRSLQFDDVPPVLERESCIWNFRHLEKSMPRRPERENMLIIQAIYWNYSFQFCIVGFLLFGSCILSFAGPILLSALVLEAERGVSISQISLYVSLLISSKILTSVLSTQYVFRSKLMEVAIVAGLRQYVFRKTLLLSTESRRYFSSGMVSNLYTVDVERIVGVLLALHNAWALPLQIGIAMVLLLQELDNAMWAGLCSIALILALNVFVSYFLKRANDLVMQSKDARMKLTSEMLASMLHVKLNAWEESFERRILEKRAEELKHVWSVFYIVAVNIFLFWMAPCIVSVVSITVYAAVMRRKVTAAKIFSSISLFRLLQGPLRALPGYINQLYQAWTSAVRLESFLHAPERSESHEEMDPQLEKESVVLAKGCCSIEVGMSYSWFGSEEERNTLERLQERYRDAKSRRSRAGDFHKETTPQRQARLRPPRSTSQSLLRHSLATTAKSIFRSLPSSLKRATKTRGTASYIHSFEKLRMEEASTDADLEAADIYPGVGSDSTQSIHSSLSESHEDSESTDFSLRVTAELAIKRGFLVVVTGAVGSGKSSFLSAILGDMYHSQNRKCQGHLSRGSLAYASQQPWIRNATLKDNILFGRPYEEGWYREVVHACALAADLQQLPQGDNTEVGERGLTLSGGQKARVALARAVYRRADIVLLDDVLSALDTVVARGVFSNCVLGLLRDCTRVMVTHNEEVPGHPAVDLVLRIEKGAVSQTLPTALDHSEVAEVARDKWEAAPGLLSSLVAVDVGCCISLEDREEGRVSGRVYLAYIHAIGGFRVVAFLCVVQTCWQCLSVGSDVFLSYWTHQSDEEQQRLLQHNISWYATLSLSSGLLVLVRTLTVSYAGYSAAKTMFAQMLSAIIRAPMHWHDRNSSGRILNRMGDDQAKLDGSLAIALGSIFATGFSLGGDLIAVLVITRYLIFFMVPVLVIYAHVMSKYLSVSRELQRMQSVTLSPLLTSISECAHGSAVIRAFGSEAEAFVSDSHARLVDDNNRMSLLAGATSAWFQLRIECLGSSILLCICVLSFLGHEFISPGLVGLCISYGMTIIDGLESIVMILSNFENMMVSPERIQQYVGIVSEGDGQKALYRDPSDPIDTAKDKDQLSLSAYAVCFDDVWFKYQPGSDVYALRGVSFNVEPGRKVGICGRTGSGKSSMSMCLFRIAELARGRVLLYGRDASTLSLSELRRSIEIVPQTPVLFTGPIRRYMDPFGEFEDSHIRAALTRVGLLSVLTSLSAGAKRRDKSRVGEARGGDDVLDAVIEENGNNLSVGERQLAVLARALLRKAEILVMDEATASVDLDTDRRIQELLSQEFRHATVFTIAHRMETIISSDVVIVMNEGRVLEMGSPTELLRGYREGETLGGHFRAFLESNARGTF